MNKSIKHDQTSVNELMKLLSLCPSLRNISRIIRVGVLASTPLHDQKKCEKIRASLQSKPEQLPFEGSWADDISHWYLVVYDNSQGALIEIHFYAELLVDDAVVFLRSLEEDEVADFIPYVKRWMTSTKTIDE